MKKFSSKRSVQLIAHYLKEYDIQNVIVSPGSRNAPLAIHFAELDFFNCYSIVDERSAAFVGLGMAKSLKKPVAITCTSGSAAANYYPAVTEAFYQNIPMLIFSADRPTDYVDLFDGQTIRQKNLFHQHSYGDFELKEDDKEDAELYNAEILKKAVELCIEKQGPVHVNVPLSEPLYDLVNEIPEFPTVEKTIQTKKFDITSGMIADWHTSKRIMVLVGTRDYSEELEAQLGQLVKNHTVVVLSEVNSNLKNDKFFPHIDRYIFNFTEEDYKTYAPDLLITVGQNVVSKVVKRFLREAKPANHWHIDPVWQPDTYFALTQKVEVKPEVFFRKLLNDIQLEPRPYFNLWDVLKDKKDRLHQDYCFNVPFSDFYVFQQLANYIPEKYHIHFSNSSAIRYAQLFEYKSKHIHCNRGTSGIDGCTSTAMGYAIKNPDPTVLITGDVSFFYDINGLWNAYIPPFTRIIIINNGEGNIFKIIQGPSNADDNILNEFIATKHHKTAESLAKHFKMGYVKVEDDNTLERVLANFFVPDMQPKILEIFTDEMNNAEMLKNYFKSLK